MRVRDKDFEDVEAFVLDHFAVVLEQVHAEFEVVAAVDVFGHDVVVCAVEEKFAQELDGLAFCNVRIGLDEGGVVAGEEEVEVDGEVVGGEGFVLGKDFLRWVVRVGVPFFTQKGDWLTLNVVNASVLTSKAPPSIQGKNFQKTPSPNCLLSTSMSSSLMAFSFS